jgi:apolipoprotein N-acyltransferase
LKIRQIRYAEYIIILLRKHWIATPLLTFLAYPNFDFSPLRVGALCAWVAIVPALLAIRGASGKKLYLTALVNGLVTNLVTFGWMGNFGSGVPEGRFLLIVLLIPLVATIWATKLFLAEMISRRVPYRWFVYPAVWIALDYVQSLGFLAFPWMYWGYTQYQMIPLLQLSSVTGVFGVTFLIVMVNAVIADTITKIKNPSNRGRLYDLRGGVLIALLVVVLLIVGAVRIPRLHPVKKSSLSVTMIQTCIDPWEDYLDNRYDYLKDLMDHTTEALSSAPVDLVIWTESATLETITYGYLRGMLNKFEYLVLKYADITDVPILTGEIGQFNREDGGFYYTNSACLIDGSGRVRDSYAKIHLAPIGEFFPYDKVIPGARSILDSMGAADFRPGEKPVIFTVNKVPFGVLICYEGMFFRLAREYRRLGAGALVNITNDSWSGYWGGHMQHYAASVFRAVENGVWYLRAGNTGYTTILDPYGRVRGAIPVLKKGYLTGSIDLDENCSTFYTRYGDVFTIAVVSVLLLLVLLSLFRVWRER